MGLGGRLTREVFNISATLGLAKVAFELVVQREKEAATLEDRIKDCWGNYQDVMILEIPVADRKRW